MRLRQAGFGLAALCLVAGGCVSTQQSLAPIETRDFELDPAHAFLSAKVVHFGISDYVVDLTGLTGSLDFDAEAPTRSQLTLSIDPMSLDTQFPDPAEKAEWERELATSSRYLDGETHPEIRFTSTSIEQTGAFTGRVTGDLTLRGVTRPVTLDVTYNGTATSPLDNGRRRLGFTAEGSFLRSEFGMGALTQFVSDEVRIEFSGEFLETRTTASDEETD